MLAAILLAAPGGEPSDKTCCADLDRYLPDAGWIATMPLPNISLGARAGVGLAPGGDTLVVIAASEPDHEIIMAGFSFPDRRESWRRPWHATGRASHIAVSPDGRKAAIWEPGMPRVWIAALPGGETAGEIPLAEPYPPADLDVSFSQDSGAIIVGDVPRRRIYNLSDPAAPPVPAPGFDGKDTGNSRWWRDCSGRGPVGQSDVGSVRSRDGALVVFLPGLGAMPGRTDLSGRGKLLGDLICGARSGAWPAPAAELLQYKPVFASFSPDDNHLAVVYHSRDGQSEPRALIKIWDSSARAARPDPTIQVWLTFPIPGPVGYRIGWSPDGRRLATVRAAGQGFEARLHAVP